MSLCVVCVFLFVFSIDPTNSQTSITEKTPIPWVPPDAGLWKNAKLKESVKAYFEMEWGKCVWEESCSDERLEIIPVYFWPGERIDLPCAMCQLAFVFNGRMKRWGMAEDIPSFLEDPQKAVYSRKNWNDVKNNDSTAEKDTLPHSYVEGREDSTTDQKESPKFLQRDGKLSIIRASPTVQGVYFCYDEGSLALTNLFYVVTAMVPPVSLLPDKAFTDGCTAADFIIPSFNWRFHFLPAVRDDNSTGCNKDPQKCGITNATREEDACDLDHCRIELKNAGDNSVTDFHLAIELRWNEWTNCTGGVQRREAHCYLVREEDRRIPETVDATAWLEKLNSLFNLEPFKKEGIRLYSSLFPSLIQDENKLSGCQMKSEATLETAYRDVIFYTMGVRTDEGKKIDKGTDYSFRLDNPFRACLGFEKEKTDWELVVGTYMVESRSC